jgi:hypothetical protein
MIFIRMLPFVTVIKLSQSRVGERQNEILMDMQATMQPPELLPRLIPEHGERRRTSTGQRVVKTRRQDVNFSLIPKEKTGLIMPVAGADLDQMFALDSLAPGR